MQDKMQFLADNWDAITAIILAILSLVARLTPTAKNYDWVSGLLKTIGQMIPNRKKDPVTGEITVHK